MKNKNSNQEIFAQYTGKNVEITLRPDLPALSGKVKRCNENFIAIGDALLSYQMIWGIRIINDTSEEQPKTEEISVPEVPPVPPVVEPKIAEVHKEVKKEKITPKADWENKIFEGELIEFHSRRKYGSIFCPELKDYGVPVTDNDKIFVHANQISDENLKNELLEKDLKDKMIRVTFKISTNEKGSCADDVRAKEKIIPSKKMSEKIKPEPISIPVPVETKTIEPKIEIKTNSEDESELDFEQLLERNLDWKKQTFEGDLVAFNNERMFGFIQCSEIDRYIQNSEDTEEGNENIQKKIFVHLNQINDIDLRQKLLDEKNPKPNVRVVFSLKDSEKGLLAVNVRSKFKISNDVLQVQTSLALYEEGEIEYFRRYESIPHGKIRAEGNRLYKFYEESITDPALLVFLECSPNAEGQKVRFTKGKKGKDIIIQNLEAAEPFPEYRVNDWERTGMLQKARERLKIK